MKTNSFFCLFCLASLFCAFPAFGQAGSAKPTLAPGTLITIDPDISYESVYNRADMVELLATLPEVDAELTTDVRFNKEQWAKDVRYERDIWCLQFAFKPVRIIEVALPNQEGTLEKKLVWYLVYNVKNMGPAALETVKKNNRTDYELSAGSVLGTEIERSVEMPRARDTQTIVDDKNVLQTRDAPLDLRHMPGTFQPRPGKTESIRFVPQFTFAIDRLVLGSETENDPVTGKIKTTVQEESVYYVDQSIPLALLEIVKREGMTALPETTVSFPTKELKEGEDRWGVAMWTGIDPRVHRFSVYVTGLTNAYKWQDDGTNTGKPGDGRSMKRKVLKTNWWRIGDRYNVNDGQIRYGIPGEVDFEWLFL